MPIYGYSCASCGHELDALQKISDAPLTDCPECEASALKRQLSAPRFRLKGQGWYETDFKTDNKRNLADGKPSESAAKSETKTDSKPAAKAEPKKTASNSKSAKAS